MAENSGKSGKKDATTSTRPPNSVMGDSDSSSDEYQTAEGSAQSIEKAKKAEKAEKAKKDDKSTLEKDESKAELDPLPWRAGGASKQERIARPNQSIVSVNPSVFGEDQRPKFDSETRRTTINWPPSGCIHIPLRDPNDPNKPSETDETDENRTGQQ